MSDMFDVGRLVADPDAFYDWLREKGLIPRSKMCPDCAKPMRIAKPKPMWICSFSSLHPDKKFRRQSLFNDIEAVAVLRFYQ